MGQASCQRLAQSSPPQHAFSELLFQPEQTVRLGFARQAFQHWFAILNSQILIGREVVIGLFGGRFQLRTKPGNK